MKKFAVTLLSFCLFSCASERNATQPVQVVPAVNLNKYAGKWYEIARFPHFFQRNCYNSSAEYGIINESTISVLNQCNMGSAQGKQKQIAGKARVVPGSNGAKLKVRFDSFPAGLFEGDYWVTMLDENYNWAVVTDSKGAYLWVLSKDKNMPDTTYNNIVSKLAESGFRTEFLRRF